mmetsp:Transcript_99947/g.308413  ORF Transcript_99947/g.308413 Transcript_99947/m.308413 type:complete len:386 (-) Transcript_99947:564-1721(-)
MAHSCMQVLSCNSAFAVTFVWAAAASSASQCRRPRSAARYPIQADQIRSRQCKFCLPCNRTCTLTNSDTAAACRWEACRPMPMISCRRRCPSSRCRQHTQSCHLDHAECIDNSSAARCWRCCALPTRIREAACAAQAAQAQRRSRTSRLRLAARSCCCEAESRALVARTTQDTNAERSSRVSCTQRWRAAMPKTVWVATACPCASCLCARRSAASASRASSRNASSCCCRSACNCSRSLVHCSRELLVAASMAHACSSSCCCRCERNCSRSLAHSLRESSTTPSTARASAEALAMICHVPKHHRLVTAAYTREKAASVRLFSASWRILTTESPNRSSSSLLDLRTGWGSVEKASPRATGAAKSGERPRDGVEAPEHVVTVKCGSD